MFTVGPGFFQQVSGASHTYTTWNPSDKGTLVVLSGGNLGLSNSVAASGTWNMVRATQSKVTGKWYAEMTDNAGSGYGFGGGIGVATSSANLSAELGSDTGGWGLYGKRADTGHPLMEHNGSVTNFNTIANGIQGTVYRVAYDADAGNVWFGVDSVWAGGGDPSAGTTPTFTVTPGTALFLAGAAQNDQMSILLNAGATSFAQAVPTGFNTGWYV